MAGSPDVLDMLAVLSDEADEPDEEDDSGRGWLAGWQPNQNPPKRNISLSVAELRVYTRRTSRRQSGRPADINHRCVFI